MNDNLRGILLLLGGMGLLSLMDACNKALAALYDPVQVVWFRYAVFFLVAVWVCRHTGLVRAVRVSRRPRLQLARSLMAAGQNVLIIACLARLPLADLMALLLASPVLATLLAAVVLRERVDARRWLAVAVSFAGVLAIVRPGFATFDPWMLVALAGAACFACYQVTTRMVAAHDPWQTTFLMTALPALAVIGGATPFVWQSPEGWHWALFIASGLLASGGHLLMIRAFDLAEASLLQPYNYSILLWATLIGYLLFDEVPDGWTVAGGAAIVAGGLYGLGGRRTAAAVPAPPQPRGAD